MNHNTFVFCLLVSFIFWVATMGDKGQEPEKGIPEETPAKIPGEVAPAMAGGSLRENE